MDPVRFMDELGLIERRSRQANRHTDRQGSVFVFDSDSDLEEARHILTTYFDRLIPLVSLGLGAAEIRVNDVSSEHRSE